jgi:hypothetical protein
MNVSWNQLRKLTWIDQIFTFNASEQIQMVKVW